MDWQRYIHLHLHRLCRFQWNRLDRGHIGSMVDNPNWNTPLPKVVNVIWKLWFKETYWIVHQIKKIFHSKYKPGSTAKGFADMVKANIEFHFLDILQDKVHIWRMEQYHFPNKRLLGSMDCHHKSIVRNAELKTNVQFTWELVIGKFWMIYFVEGSITRNS